MRSIGFLQYNFLSGGAQNIIVKTANLFVEHGYNCTIIVISNHGPLKDKLHHNVVVKDLKGNTIRKSIFPLIKLLKRDNYDYVITTLLGPSILLILCKLLIFSKTKVIVREASTPSQETKLKFKSRILHYIAPLVLRFADSIVAVSNGVKNDLHNYYGIDETRIKVIYNPVFSLDFLKTSIANRKGVTPKKLIYLGRISRVKRIEIQIEAFALAFNRNPDLTFSIVGNSVDDEYVIELKALIKELGIEKNIHWYGYCSDISSVLNDHHILLLTSSYEGLPSVLIEALAFGLEVIACNCENGPREILDRGRFGQLIPFDECNPIKLSEVILGLTENQASKEGLIEFLERFSNESVIQKYLQILK